MSNDYDLDNPDIDPFNPDDSGFDISDLDEPSNDRSPTEDYVVGALEGLKNAATNPSNIRKLLEKALPNGFGEAMRVKDAIDTRASSIISDIKTDVTPAINNLKQTAATILPKVEQYLPESVNEKVKEFTKTDTPETQNTNPQAEAEAASRLKASTDAEADLGDSGLNNATAKKLRAKGVFKDIVENRRFLSNNNHLVAIHEATKRTADFQQSVTARYQRKSLELAYRQYYLLTDTHKLHQAAYKETIEVLLGINKNTSLPDFVKLRTSESAQEMLRERILNKGIQRFQGSDIYSYINQLFDNIGKQTKNFTSDLLGTTTDLRDMAEDLSGAAGMADGLDDNQKRELYGNLAAETAGGYAMGWLGSKLKRRLAANRTVTNTLEKVSQAISDTPGIIDDALKNRTYDNNPLTETFLDLYELVHPNLNARQGEVVNKATLNNLHDPGLYSNRTDRTITDIIPQLLSRILQSSEKHRLGTEDVPLLGFDFASNSFIDNVKRKAQLKETILKSSFNDADYALDNLVNSFDRNKTLDTNTRDIVKKALYADSRKDLRFKPEKYADPAYWNKLGADGDKLSELFIRHYRLQLNDEGEYEVNKERLGLKRLTEAKRKWTVARDARPQVAELIDTLANSGDLQALRELGFIKGNQIDTDFIDSQYGAVNANTTLKDDDKRVTPTVRPVSGVGTPNTEGNSSWRVVSSTDYRPGNNVPVVPVDPSVPREQPFVVNADIRAFLNQVVDAINAPTWVAHVSESINKPRWVNTFADLLKPAPNEATFNPDAITNKAAMEKLLAATEAGPMYAMRTIDAIGETNRLLTENNRARTSEHTQTTELLGQLLTLVDALVEHNPVAGTEPRKKRDFIFTNRVWRAAGSTLNAGSKLAQGYVKAVRKMLSTSASAAFGAIKNIPKVPKGLLKGLRWTWLKDIYVNGELVIQKSLLLAGEYYDRNGKVITDLRQALHGIYDRDGNLLVSAERLKGKFTDVNGKEIRNNVTNWLSSKLNAAKDLLLAPTRGVFRFVKDTVFGKASSAYKTKLFSVVDMYIPGETKPALYAVKIRKRHYINAIDGSVILAYEDIKSDVMDISLNPPELVLTYEQALQGLIDANGKPIRSTTGRLMGNIKDAVTGVYKGAMGLAKGIISRGSKVIGNIGRFASNFVPEINIGGGSGNRNTNDILARIYNLLLRKFGYDDLKPIETEGFVNPPRTATKVKDKLVELIERIVPPKGDKPERKTLRERVDAFNERLKAQREATKAKFIAKKAEVIKNVPMPKTEGWGSKVLMLLTGLLTTLKTAGGKILDALKALAVAKTAGGIADAIGGVDVPDSRKPNRAGRFGGLFRTVGTAAATTAATSAVTGAATAGAGAATATTAAAAGAGATAAATRGALLRTGAGIAGRVAIGAAASLFSIPVILGGIAAYGAYRGFQYLDGEDYLIKLRYLHYGINPDVADQTDPIEYLESELEGYVKFSGNNASIQGNIDFYDLMAEFGISANDARMVQQWTEWFNNRFKPVYLQHLGLLRVLDPSAALDDIDDDLDDAKKVTFVKGVRFSPDRSPYPFNVAASPFPNYPITTGTKAIDMLTKVILTEFAEDAKDYTPSAEVLKASVNNAEVKPAAAATGTSAATGVIGVPINSSPMPKSPLLMSSEVRIDRLRVAEDGTGLDNLTLIRMRAYGLTKMTTLKVDTLLALEAQMLKEFQIRKIGSATVGEWKGNPEDLFVKFASYFDGSATDLDYRAKWLYWFNERFKPVFLTYVSAVRRESPTMLIQSAWRELSAIKLVRVAQAIRDASLNGKPKGDYWKIDISPWVNYSLETNPASIESYLRLLQAKADKESYEDNPFAGGNLSDTYKKSLATANGTPPTIAKSPSLTPTVTEPPKNPSTVELQRKRFSRMESRNPNLKVIDGAGGTYSQIPDPKTGESWDAYQELLTAAGGIVGVDPELLGTMAMIESGFRANVKAKTSSALGLFQFTNSTWREMMDRYGDAYGIPKNAKATDPKAAALLAAQYLKDNKNILDRNIGRPVNATDIYTAHFLGAGGASKFLKADPNMSAAKLLPSAARANQSIFYDNERERSVGEIYDLLDRKVSGKSVANLRTVSPVNDKGQAIASAKSVIGNSTYAKALEPTTFKSTAPVTPGVIEPISPTKMRTVSYTPSQMPTNTDVMLQSDNARKANVERVKSMPAQPVVDNSKLIIATNNILEKSLGVQQQILAAIESSMRSKPLGTAPSAKPAPVMTASTPTGSVSTKRGIV